MKTALLLQLALAHVITGALGLWPLPRSLETGSSALKLAPNFNIYLDVPHAPADIEDAVSRTQSELKSDKLGPLVVGRGSTKVAAVSKAKSLTVLHVQLAEGAAASSITEEARKEVGTRSEEYVLEVPADGSAATLTANSTLGLLRGLTTFGQLFYETSGTIYTMEAPISISDSPAYVSASTICAVNLLSESV